MSSGKFLLTRYETQDDSVAPIVVQPETVSLVINAVPNTPPPPPVSLTVTINASGNSRRKKTGVYARQVSFRWTGVVPAGYDPVGILRLPLLNKQIANEAARGVTGTYLGQSIVVLGSVGQVPVNV